MNQVDNPQGLHILHRAIAGDAFHDSAERYPQPRCHPETRMEMLDELENWARGNEPSENGNAQDDEDDGLSSEDLDFCEKRQSSILWLHGPAGSGKSAIAQSLCQRLQADDQLGGSFFFKRGDSSRGNAKKLFPTIAYQLALLLPSLNRLILQKIETDPAIVDRSLPNQFQALIIEPCRNLALVQPVSILIDGLDECEGHDVQKEILRSIADAVDKENIPLRFFITSRPEPHITQIFREPGLAEFHWPFYINQSFEDVRKYLQDEFLRIHRQHRITMATVPQPWPSSEVVEGIVNKSSGYFIYASTVIRFIDDKNFRPKDRLDIIMGLKERGSGSPFDTLDQLYLQILSLVPQDYRPQLLRISTVIAAELELHMFHIEQLLELEFGDYRLILRGLHSVISMPEEDEEDDIRSYRTAHHASFLDFLADSTRSGPFYIGGAQHRADLVYHMLKAMSCRDSDRPIPVQYDGWHVGW
jgi:ABC-type dipeptide/oligopeptide/nickel transport system ATPase component